MNQLSLFIDGPSCDNHYANMSMLYAVILKAVKMTMTLTFFQLNFFYIFLIFAQNIDCGYHKNRLIEVVLRVPTIYALEQN